MQAIIYSRFSPRRNAAECESIETQLERCRDYCRAAGYAVAGEHQDRELSGGRMDNRPGLQAALADACKKKAVLVVYSLSRLARNTRDAIEIADRLDKCGADLASLHERIDTATAMGRFVFKLMAAIAELEREQIGERTSDAMQRHQASGRRMSHHAPYGTAPEGSALVVNEQEQKTINRIKGLRAEGLGYDGIAAVLMAEGYQPRGKRWHGNTIKRILER